MKKYTNFLEASLLNLKASVSEWSMENFVAMTIETLMNIERSEYLANTVGADKGNGYYSRALKSLSKNCLAINIPRTRTGNFSPNAIELPGEYINLYILSKWNLKTETLYIYFENKGKKVLINKLKFPINKNSQIKI